MNSVRTEGSLLTSLNELRAIEQQRLAEEHAAVEAALKAKRDAREAAERHAREAEAARVAAERDARVAAEQARAEAERQARLHIEATEAAERARQLMALEQRRFDEELELRREVARRQRPRWMIALTGIAVTAALGLAGFAIERQHESNVARQEQARADNARIAAEDEMRRIQAELDQMDRQVHELEANVNAAIERVRLAQTEATRKAEEDNLRQLQRHEADLREQRRQREEERKRKEREAGFHLSDDCKNNAVCK